MGTTTVQSHNWASAPRKYICNAPSSTYYLKLNCVFTIDTNSCLK